MSSNKTIELKGDWDIPEGYTNTCKRGKVKAGEPFLSFEDKVSYSIYDQECVWCLIPERKVIDWEKIIDNKVLCEFSNFSHFNYSIMSTLKGIDDGFVASNELKGFKSCRPAQGILFGHDGGECPLPDGFLVKATIYSYEPGYGLHDDGGWRHSTITNNSENIDWEKVVSYKIIGLTPDYTY